MWIKKSQEIIYRFVLLQKKRALEKKIKGAFDRALSNKIDAIIFLLEDEE